MVHNHQEPPGRDVERCLPGRVERVSVAIQVCRLGQPAHISRKQIHGELCYRQGVRVAHPSCAGAHQASCGSQRCATEWDVHGLLLAGKRAQSLQTSLYVICCPHLSAQTHDADCTLDWLRDKVYFERLIKKDPYIKNRLGYTAPNIYVMALY